MPDTPVERGDPPRYPQEMETRVAILEHIAAETTAALRDLRAEMREMRADMHELVNTKIEGVNAKIEGVNAKIDGAVNSVRAELQKEITLNTRWTVGTILVFGIAVVGLLAHIAHLY